MINHYFLKFDILLGQNTVRQDFAPGFATEVIEPDLPTVSKIVKNENVLKRKLFRLVRNLD